MSAPFAGVPAWPAASTRHRHNSPPKLSAMTGLADPGLDAALGRLTPPRKHYQWFYSTPEANADMQHCPAGVHAFLRAYYHMKSADWAANKPHPLAAWSADALAGCPRTTSWTKTRHGRNRRAASSHQPSRSPPTAGSPITNSPVYAGEYARTGFQGGLNWYRAVTGGLVCVRSENLRRPKITVPTCFIAGASDWGIYQKPGDFEAMQTNACADFRGAHMIEGAGHWVQQEQPEAVISALLDFLRSDQ